ncbi:AbrB/MazE/SpoVT family DNA-binding domain-containing protein [Patescibacteria group bacterium]
MIQKVVKTGNSLAVTVPSKFVKKVGLKAGDRVKSEVLAETNTIKYSFLDTRQLPLSSKFLKNKSEQ